MESYLLFLQKFQEDLHEKIGMESKYIGMRLEIALIPVVGDVWKAPDIQKAALCCIFHSILR